MESFALSESATRELMSRVKASSCDRPTASLNETSDELPTSQEMIDAIRRNAGDEELRSIAVRNYGDSEELAMHLDVGLYDEADCPRNDLVIIGGIQFVLPSWMLALLAGCQLDYVQNCFVLAKGDRIYRRIFDLAKEESGAV